MKNIKKILFKICSFFKDDNFALKIIYKTSIGKNCRLRNNNYGSEPYLISIGNHVSAINVDFLTHDGAVWLWREENPKIDLLRPIKIESNIFIGHKSIILPGTYIESNVIIGAGSIIKGRIPGNTVYAGSPAKPICSIQEYYKKNENYFQDLKLMDFREKENFINKNKNKDRS